jgi:hypothetical protein
MLQSLERERYEAPGVDAQLCPENSREDAYSREAAQALPVLLFTVPSATSDKC